MRAMATGVEEPFLSGPLPITQNRRKASSAVHHNEHLFHSVPCSTAYSGHQFDLAALDQRLHIIEPPHASPEERLKQPTTCEDISRSLSHAEPWSQFRNSNSLHIRESENYSLSSADHHAYYAASEGLSHCHSNFEDFTSSSGPYFSTATGSSAVPPMNMMSDSFQNEMQDSMATLEVWPELTPSSRQHLVVPPTPRRSFLPALSMLSVTPSFLRFTPSTVPDVLLCSENGCPKIFTGSYRSRNKSRHMRLKHGHSEKSYPCESKECSKTFKRQDARLKHHRSQHPHLADAAEPKNRQALHDEPKLQAIHENEYPESEERIGGVQDPVSPYSLRGGSQQSGGSNQIVTRSQTSATDRGLKTPEGYKGEIDSTKIRNLRSECIHGKEEALVEENNLEKLESLMNAQAIDDGASTAQGQDRTTHKHIAVSVDNGDSEDDQLQEFGRVPTSSSTPSKEEDNTSDWLLLPTGYIHFQDWLHKFNSRGHGTCRETEQSVPSPSVGAANDKPRIISEQPAKFKRRRKQPLDDDDDDNDDDDGHNGRKRRPKQLPTVGMILEGLLACHFAKHEPLAHTGCWTFATSKTSELK
jgi:hypothetical protein